MPLSGTTRLKELRIRLDGQALAFYSNGGREELVPIEIGRVPSLHFEPDEKRMATIRMATIRNGRLVSDKPTEGEKNEKEASKKVLV